jgi:hypothetical protein
MEGPRTPRARAQPSRIRRPGSSGPDGGGGDRLSRDDQGGGQEGRVLKAGDPYGSIQVPGGIEPTRRLPEFCSGGAVILRYLEATATASAMNRRLRR